MILESTAAILLRLRLREKRIVAIDFIVGMVYFHARSVGHVSSFSIRVRPARRRYDLGMRQALFIMTIFAAAFGTAGGAEPKTWRVVSVHDGDTVRCLDDGNTEHKIRLTGIDAPETGQPFGTVSRDHLRQLVLRREVVVHEQGKDKYGRTLARLEVDGKDVAATMVAEGLAWHYVRYSDDQQLARAEREAKAAARGLWADREPMPPWEWRKAEHERKAAPTR